MNELERIVARTRARGRARGASGPARRALEPAPSAAAADPPRPFARGAGRPGLSVIAEHKRALAVGRA